MNDKLEQLYNLYKQNGIIQSTDFNTFSSASDDQRKKLYDLGRQKGLFKTTDYNTFSSAFRPIKKKEQSVSPSAQNQKPTSSATQQTKKPKPSVSSSVGGKFAAVTEAVEKKKSTAQKDTKPQIVFPGQEGKRNDIFTGYPGNEGKKYRLDNSTGTPVWMEYTSSAVKGANSSQNYEIYNTPITDPARVAELNKHFKKNASSSEIDQVFTGFPGKESNEYRVRDGKWERKEKGSKSWQTVINEGSILGLNKQFKQNVEPTKDIEKAKIDQKKEIENKKNMNILLASINSDLVGSSEEYASEELEKKFPGFNFIQQGPFTDQLLVIAPNDNRVKISLDNFTDGDDRTQATRLREFIRNNSDQGLTLASERLSAAEEKERRFNEDELKRRGIIPPEFKFVDGKLQVDFTEEINKNDINQTARSIVKNNIESEIKNARKEYIDKKEQQFNDIYHRFKGSNASSQEITSAYASVKKDDYEIKRVNQYMNDIKGTSEDVAKEKASVEDYTNDAVNKLRSGEITKDQFESEYKPEIDRRVAELKNKGNALADELNNIQNVNKAIDESVAKNYIIDEATGSFGGGMTSKFVKGLTYLPRLMSLGEMSSKDQDEVVRLITGGGTTKEYMESEDRSDLVKSLFSLSESMGALVSGSAFGGGAATYAAFYAQSYYEMKDDLDQVEGMSETSKVLMSAVYGGLSSVLEKYGMDLITQKSAIGKNFKNNVLKKMFADLPRDASKEYIDAAMMNSIKMTLAEAGLKSFTGSLGEGVTESLQSLTQVGIKEAYDLANNTDYFNNKSGWEILSDVIYEGYLGALGGGVMSTVTSSPKVLKNGVLNALNGEQAELLMNAANTEGIDKALVTNLKASVLTGKITKEEAINISNSFSNVKSKINQIPSDLSVSDKAKALDLMVEKSTIEDRIAGKDPNLVSKETERINEINEQLKTISQNAVQEQTTGEVSVQPETTTGQEVEGGKPEAELKKPTQEEITAKEKELDSVWSEKNKLQDKLEGQGLTEDEIRSNEEFRSLIDRADVLSSEIFNLKDSIKEEVTIDKPTIATNATVELDRVKSVDMESEDGATFNLDGTKYEGGGLIVPVASTNTTIEEINPEMIADFVEANSGKIGDKNTVKVGIYKFPNSNKVSIDLNVVAPESSRDQAIEFGKQADQESLFDLSTFENVKTGGTGMNPMQFTDDQFKEIAKALNEGRVPNVFGQQQSAGQIDMDTTLSNIKEAAVSGNKMAGSMYKAIRSSMQAMPGVKIFVHDSKEAYQEAISRSTGQNKDQVVEDETNDRSAGTILPNGEIHIDASIADAATVYHEMFHYAVMQKGLSAADIRSIVDAVKSSTKNKELIARAEAFAKQYEDGEIDEEFFSELGALLTASEELLQPKNIQKFFTIINNMFKKWGLPVPFGPASTRQDAIDFINSLSKGMREGTDVGISEKIINSDPASESAYGTVKIRKNRKYVKAPSVKNDSRSFIKKFVEDVDINDFEGQKFVTNMYDYTNAGETDLGNGFKITLFGGKNYVPYMMELTGKSIGDVSNLAAFNTKAQAETFIRNAKESGAVLFAPHVGTKSQSWQFQQHTFAELVNLVISQKILTKAELISTFNSAITVQKTKGTKIEFEKFTRRLGKNIKNFNSFVKNPMEIVDLLDIDNNFSPDLRKLLNNSIASNKKFQNAIGVKNKEEFYNRIMDPLNEGTNGGEIMGIVEFDPNTFEIVKTTVNDIDHHPSFGWTLMAKIEGIYQPTEFIKSVDLTDSYTSYNKGETKVSKKSEEENFEQKNVSSSAGAIPKVGEIKGRSKRLAPKVAEKLTEDGNGNYVFQHWSSQKRDVIKPGTGQNSITGKDEASSLSAVGGLAQYYTMKDQSESGTGNVLHTVLVPMDKVYDAYNDPMGFAEEARRQFNELRPGQGFDEGYRAAFITKVANENGYDMTVYPWRNTELRAQTTLELKPEEGNIDFKDRAKDEYNVGDKINVYGNDAVVTSVEGPIVRFKSETSQGSINVERSPRSIRKKRKAPKNEAISKAKEKYDISIDRGNSVDQARKSAMSDLKKNDWYANATDIEREDAVRDLRKFFGLKEKSAPSVKKVLGKADSKTVTMNVSTLRDEFIKARGAAAKQAAKSIKDVQREIAAKIKDMVKSGKVSAKQAAILTDRLARLNTENPLMVERYLAYAEKVFENADYAQRLSDAFSIRKKIKRLSKSPNNQAEVRAMGKAFLEIDPSMVDDIDVYNEMAQMIFDALKPSRVSGTDAIYKSAALIEDVNIYTNEMVSMQEDKKKKEMLNLYSELVSAGVLSEDMSFKDIQTIVQSIENDEDVSKKDEKAVRDYNKNTFGMLSSIVRDAMNTGVDPITGESVDWDENATDLIKRLMNIDMDRLSVREGFMAIEALQNFMVNGITSGVEATVYAYDGALNAEKVANEGIKARDLRVYLSKMAGRIMSANFATIPVLFDSMFGGVRNGGRVMEAMGLSRYSNGVAKATKIMNNIVNEYGKVFSKQKPNGESFNSSKNVYERGMLAFLKRTVMGSDAEMNEELARRISLLRDSIKELRKGGDSDMKKADIYEELFSKLGLDQEGISIIDIESRVDKINRDAVDWWIGKWSEHYPDLYDVSLSVFNTQLGKDLNYTPDRFSRTETSEVMSKTEQEEMLAKAGAFSINMDFTDKNKSGVLMEATRPKKTPGRYVDLDFDMSNSNAMKAALIDINTAGVVRQIDSFLRSDAFKSMIPNKKDYTLLRGRVNSYIRRTKGKDAISNDSLRELNKVTNVLAGLGATKALGGIFQPIKQTLPVMMNTLINAGRFNPMSVMDKGYNEWIDRSGMSIANRGIESSASIDTANKYLDKAADGKVETVLNAANKLNETWLKIFLSSPDVVVARASFQAYYKQDLKRQGVSTDIDWTNHDINQEAANYAQHMVDRQQNVSDAAMGGEFMASNDTTKKLVRKVAMPFANFVMNQKNRMYSDIRTLQNSMSTKEDKITAWRSLVGLTVEMVSYQVIAYTIREAVIKPIAAAIAGYIPDDEEEEKQKKYAMQNVVSQGAKDFLSPMPFFDGATLAAFNYVADKVQDVANWAEGDSQGLKDAIAMKNESLDEPMTGKDLEDFKQKWNEDQKWKFENFNNESVLNLGTLTIMYDKISTLLELADVAKTGEFTKEYNGIETKQYLMEEDRSILKPMVAVEALHILGALPVEASSITRNVEKFVKKKGITETQKDKYDLVKKKYGKVEPWMMEIVKSKKREDGTIQEIEWVKSFGDLNEKQGSKYVEIFKKREGQVTYDDMMRISKMK